jgi:hypothetical protein
VSLVVVVVTPLDWVRSRLAGNRTRQLGVRGTHGVLPATFGDLTRCSIEFDDKSTPVI